MEGLEKLAYYNEPYATKAERKYLEKHRANYLRAQAIKDSSTALGSVAGAATGLYADNRTSDEDGSYIPALAYLGARAARSVSDIGLHATDKELANVEALRDKTYSRQHVNESLARRMTREMTRGRSKPDYSVLQRYDVPMSKQDAAYIAAATANAHKNQKRVRVGAGIGAATGIGAAALGLLNKEVRNAGKGTLAAAGLGAMLLGSGLGALVSHLTRKKPDQGAIQSVVEERRRSHLYD